MNRKELKEELSNNRLTNTDIKTLLVYNEITIDDLISVIRDYAGMINKIKEVI